MAVNVEVRLKDNETSERLIKRFKKQVTKERIMDEVKDRMYFTKKSDRKRARKREAIYRRKKNDVKAND